jgi:hypothetical protein
LSQTNEEIEAELEGMEKDTKAFKEEALRLCWYMRGSLSYSDAMSLTIIDREIINKIVKENMETTQKSGLPFF